MIEANKNTVQAVERALHLIEVLAENNGVMGVTELADKAGLTPSTVHRLLGTLMSKKFVTQDINTGKYRLGLKLFQIGNTAFYSEDLRTLMRPYLQELADTSKETVNIAVLDGNEVVYLDQIESQSMLVARMFARPGARSPAYCTATGKILLAGLDDKQLEKAIKSMSFVQYTAETITDPQSLLTEIDRIRKQEYALDWGERSEEVRCIAGPVKNYDGKTIAAISMSGPVMRMTNLRIQNELISLIKNASNKASIAMGFTGNQKN